MCPSVVFSRPCINTDTTVWTHPQPVNQTDDILPEIKSDYHTVAISKGSDPSQRLGQAQSVKSVSKLIAEMWWSRKGIFSAKRYLNLYSLFYRLDKLDGLDSFGLRD